MVVEQFLCPPNLTKTRTFYIHKPIKVIMIGENKDLVFIAFKVILSSLQSFNNGQKLTIIGFVPCFNKNHFSQKIGYRVPLAKLGLRKN